MLRKRPARTTSESRTAARFEQLDRLRPARILDVLEDVAPFLICPYCGGPLTRTEGVLRCLTGHAFDIARQGYVSLLPAGWRGGAGDTAAMVRARERFLSAGHFATMATRLADLAEQQTRGTGCIVDVGAGIGYYLTAVLERMPDRVGLALDASKHALRRAARAHGRIGAVACDIWQGLPVAANAADVLLNVFAPRNAAELARILRPTGRLLVVTPTSRHLHELVSALGLVEVDEQKLQRLAAQTSPYFELMERHDVTGTMSLSHADVEAVVAMGPSAWHTDPAESSRRIQQLPEPASVTLSATVGIYEPLADAGHRRDRGP
jgi:23S rRNA (guanine745-N1)-methyltransferase